MKLEQVPTQSLKPIYFWWLFMIAWSYVHMYVCGSNCIHTHTIGRMHTRTRPWMHVHARARTHSHRFHSSLVCLCAKIAIKLLYPTVDYLHLGLRTQHIPFLISRDRSRQQLAAAALDSFHNVSLSHAALTTSIFAGSPLSPGLRSFNVFPGFGKRRQIYVKSS